MKKGFTTLLVFAIFAVFTQAQKPKVILKKASIDPVIDGVVDTVWANASLNNIDKHAVDDLPTLGNPGETTWQGLWTNDGIWILLTVNDDAFYPHYAIDPPGFSWQYDKPELYFDCNYLLEDDGGPLPDEFGNGNGHYQIPPPFTDGSNDGTKIIMDRGVEYAFMVNDPDYIAEYFVPFSLLLDSEGVGVDKAGDIGFDVTIIDRDPGDDGERIAVWSNIGDIAGSWTNMNDCGIITLEGADEVIYIEDISLEDGIITEDNGTLQMEATIIPEDASFTSLTWTVENGTGRASISNKGLLTAIVDGEVTVKAETQDESWLDATAVVTISNQIVTIGELNVIRNPNFDLVNGDGTATYWGGWGGDAGSPMPQVKDGVAECTPSVAAAEVWQYSFSQNNLQALPDVEYIFSLVAWAAETRTFNVDFEDTEANGYNRYGSSTSEWSSTGRSDWTFDVTPEPTRYTMDVIFDQIKYEDPKTDQLVTVQLGTSDIVTYLDSFILVSLADLDLLTYPLIVEPATVSSLKVYPNPAFNELNVVLSDENTLVAIFNSIGLKMDEVRVTGKVHKFDVSRYASGIYFVKTGESVVKFIK